MGKKGYWRVILAIVGCHMVLITGTSVFSVELNQYCSNGYYKIPGESESCSRAPCCGKSECSEAEYDQVAKKPMPNPQKCMGDGEDGRKDKGCAGYVPLCCYEMARVGSFMHCIGYWERLWCTPSQCAEAQKNGASNSECGGSCKCAHAFSSYCGNKPPIPLEQRLGGVVVPTVSAPTAVPTRIPQQPTLPSIRPTASIPTIQIPPPLVPTTPPFIIPTVPIDGPGGIIPAPTIPSIQLPGSPLEGVTYDGVREKIAASLMTPQNVVQNVSSVLDVPRKATQRVIELDNSIEQWFITLVQKFLNAITYR